MAMTRREQILVDSKATRDEVELLRAELAQLRAQVGTAPSATAVVPNAISSGGVVPPPTVTATATRPTGTQYVTYESLQSGSLTFRQVLNAVPSGKILTLPAGTFTIGSDFADSTIPPNKDCLYVPSNVGGIWGSGPNATILQMAPHSSTKASYVASLPDGETNYCNMMGIYHSNFTLANVQIKGTDQGHLYSGVNYGAGVATTGFLIQDCKFVGASPGGISIPPYETFSLSLYNTTSPQIVRCEFDGQGITSSMIGVNVTTSVYMEDVYVHDQLSGAIAFWRCRNAHLVRVKCERMGTGSMSSGYAGRPLNFEQTDGTILIESPILNCNWFGSSNRGLHLAIFNNDGTHTQPANYTLTDITHDAGPDAGGCFSMYNWTPPTSLTITKGGVTLTPRSSGTGNAATNYYTYT